MVHSFAGACHDVRHGIALIGDSNRGRAAGGIQRETIAVLRVRKFSRATPRSRRKGSDAPTQ